MSNYNMKHGGGNVLRKGMLAWMTVALSLVVAVPILANASGVGVVVEGVSVPGIELGFTRAEVEEAYGLPASCQSLKAGDFASCSFKVDGGGKVWVRYRGADGGDASNSPDDVAYTIRWGEPVSGWTTTAGVNTTLAKNDPAAVIAAYPNAKVTYTQFGSIYSLMDYEQGIGVKWIPDFRGRTYVGMGIFPPRPAPPPPEKLLRVVDIELTALKVKGQRQIRARVQVHNERHYGAPGAIVYASWVLPDGSRHAVEDATRGSSGTFAYFSTNIPRRGTYTLEIDNLVLDGYGFDRDNSVLSASIQVK